MAPSAFPDAKESCDSSMSTKATDNSDLVHLDIQQILAQFIRSTSEGGIEAMDVSRPDNLDFDIVDSLTITNCSHLLSEMISEDEDLEEESQETDSNASTAKASHGGHRHSGVQRGSQRSSVQENSDIICIYTVPTKTE